MRITFNAINDSLNAINTAATETPKVWEIKIIGEPAAEVASAPVVVAIGPSDRLQNSAGRMRT